jgi:hypothetical protein
MQLSLHSGDFALLMKLGYEAGQKISVTASTILDPKFGCAIVGRHIIHRHGDRHLATSNARKSSVSSDLIIGSDKRVLHRTKR